MVVVASRHELGPELSHVHVCLVMNVVKDDNGDLREAPKRSGDVFQSAFSQPQVPIHHQKNMCVSTQLPSCAINIAIASRQKRSSVQYEGWPKNLYLELHLPRSYVGDPSRTPFRLITPLFHPH